MDPHPGCWSLFEGAVEEGEEPAETVVRELREEIGLAQVEFHPLWRLVDTGGDDRLLTIFEARTPLSAEQMTLAEGQALRTFDRDAALRLKLAPFCRRVLQRYLPERCRALDPAHDQPGAAHRREIR